MRYTFLFLIFLSCTNGGHYTSEATLSTQPADTFSFNNDGLQQQLIIVDQSAHDSLWRAMNSNKLKKYNFSSAYSWLDLNFTRNGEWLVSQLYFISNKDWIQQLAVKERRNDTLLLKMELVKKGVLEDPWLHQISFRYKDSARIVKTILFIRED